MFKKRVLALFVILQVVVTSMFPAPAYAATYQPNVHDFWGVSDFWAVNGVSNRFDAALGLIGEWGKKIQISNANYAALSNSGSGGAFYELAQLLQPAPGEWEPGPDLGMNPIATIAWAGLLTETRINYGDPSTWLWYCYASDANIADARRDFNKVLAGESLGGGGGGGSGGAVSASFDILVHYYTFSSDTEFKVGDKYYTINPYKASNAVSLVPNRITCNIANIALPSGVTAGFVSFGRILGATGQAAVTLYYWNGSFEGDVGTQNFTVMGEPITNEYWMRCRMNGSSSPTVLHTAGGFLPYTFDGSTVTFDFSGVAFSSEGKSVPYQLYGGDTSRPYCGGMFNPTTPGPNNWPEPTTPDPDPPTTNPEPDPDPPDPPTFDPPGFDPDIPVPDVPVTIVPPDNTTAADYTPWLRAILTALNTIIDDLGEHCDHIRVAMRDYLSGFYDALSEDLQAYYDDLTDYLSDLAKWIVSHLNFDVKQPDVNVNVPGYDDSSVVGWLRRIYYKLGGSGSPKPDPIEDTDGALDWWAKFLEWITNALGGLLTDFVGDLGEFLQELIDTFPFSIPWDIVAMLTLLDAQRATPDFTVTIPAQEGWWDDITVRIELSAYNDAMATVRGMVMIWWMYILVMKTDWMMLLFDGANDAIADFVSRLTGKG